MKSNHKKIIKNSIDETITVEILEKYINCYMLKYIEKVKMTRAHQNVNLLSCMLNIILILSKNIIQIINLFLYNSLILICICTSSLGSLIN